MNPNDVSLIILSGGKGSRMGAPKAELPLGEQRLIDCLVQKGRALGFFEILLSGYGGLLEGCRSIPDQPEGRGPLGGLASSLEAARRETAFVLPVDCPGISPETILGLLRAHGSGSAQVTLLHNGGRTQPLIGVYARNFKEVIRPVILHGPAPVFRALDRVFWGEYFPGPDEPVVLNLNTKNAYLEFRKEYENHRRIEQLARCD